MSDLVRDIERFVGLVNETPGIWQSVDVRALAAEVGGQRTNLLCTATLDARATTDIPQEDVDAISAPISCHRKLLPLEELSALLTDLREGAIRLGDTSVVFHTRPQSHGASSAPYGWTFARRAMSLPRPVEAGGYPIGHYLIARGDQSQEVFSHVEDGLDGLNNALRRLARPWDGVDSIARFFLKTNSRVTASQGNVAFEAFAPIRARLDATKCQLVERALTVSVVADARAVPHLRVGFFGVSPDERVSRGTITLPKRGWKSSGGIMTCVSEELMPHEGGVSLILSAGESNIDRVEVGGSVYCYERFRIIVATTSGAASVKHCNGADWLKSTLDAHRVGHPSPVTQRRSWRDPAQLGTVRAHSGALGEGGCRSLL